MTTGRRYRLFASARGMIAVALGLALASVVVLGLVLPLDPFTLDLNRSWNGSSLAHPFGCDALGRDLFARLVVGTRTSLGIAAAAFGVALGLAALIGGVAGWLGGSTDAVLMRATDIAMGVRELALVILIATLLGPSYSSVILVLGIGWFPPLARFIRALMLVQRGQTYVLAANALGLSPFNVLLRHILPNIAGSVVVRVAAITGPLIQAEAALSFLGVGVQDPTPSLGTLIRDGIIGLQLGPHLIVATTLTTFLVSLTFTLLADELRCAVDPHYDDKRPS